LFRFDPHIVHAMGGSSTLRTAVAHRREMGGRLIVDLANPLRIELLEGRRRLTAARLVPQADYVVTGTPLSDGETRILGIPSERQLTDSRLAEGVRGPEKIVCDHETYQRLLRNEPGRGLSISSPTDTSRQSELVGSR
jgi:hypothetical protein